MQNDENNIQDIQLIEKPEYELKLVERKLKTNEEEITQVVNENLIITYKYYEIALDNEKIDNVDTIEEAEEVINEIKKQNEGKELNLTIVEKYTNNKEEINTSNIEVAKNDVQEEIIKKEELKRLEALPSVNGIKIKVKPVTGTITSRYGVSSRIRSSNHTGLDIAANKGTPIKVVADGTVTCAKYSGAYGNLVKVDHGNGVETWYGHTSKMYVTAGQKVSSGDTIAAVGSTGNSTGPHLHFEIRINGEHVDPQQYIYN